MTALTTAQLDELERKAKRSKLHDPEMPWFDEEFDIDDIGERDRDHIAANSPDVTLHLVSIARAANDACERIGKLTLSGGLPRDVWAELCKLHSVLRGET